VDRRLAPRCSSRDSSLLGGGRPRGARPPLQTRAPAPFGPAPAGSFQVVLHGGKQAAAQFDPNQRYVFGFVHHGLYPLGGKTWVHKEYN
jgi:hypothetical protein